MREGTLIPDTLVLSHPEQLDRLRRSCPEAVDAALIAGDPSHDRILAGLPWRDRYRDHLETGPRKLVLISSTWGPNSLLGAWPALLNRLLAELPVDEYRIALALHPNTWHGHGHHQVRSWLAEAERAGLRVLPPRQGWQAALVAADHVIGDHGSVTAYGASLGTHTMLGTFPDADMDPTSPIAHFGRSASRLHDDRPLLPQILSDAVDHEPGRFIPYVDRLNSEPGGSGRILRETLYRLLHLTEPEHPVRTLPADDPVPHPRRWPHCAATPPLLASAVSVEGGVRVTRHPDALFHHGMPRLHRSHLVVREDEPDPRTSDRADVVVCAERGSGVWDRLREALERHRMSALAVAPAAGTCLVLARDGRRYRLTPSEAIADPEVSASAFWRVRVNHDFAPPELTFTLHVGHRSTEVHLRPLGTRPSEGDGSQDCAAASHG